MTSAEISEIFRGGVRGQNFMTPEWVSNGQSGDFVFEISQGRGMEGERIFGLTVVEIEGHIHRTDLGGLEHSRARIMANAENLKNQA